MSELQQYNKPNGFTNVETLRIQPIYSIMYRGIGWGRESLSQNIVSFYCKSTRHEQNTVNLTSSWIWIHKDWFRSIDLFTAQTYGFYPGCATSYQNIRRRIDSERMMGCRTNSSAHISWEYVHLCIYIYIKRLKQVQWMLFFFLNHLSFARSSRRYSNNTWQTLEAVRCRTWCSSKNKSAVDILPSSTAVLLPSGKLTVRTWNTGVGSDDFPFGKPYFQGRTVSFREGS